MKHLFYFMKEAVQPKNVLEVIEIISPRPFDTVEPSRPIEQILAIMNVAVEVIKATSK